MRKVADAVREIVENEPVLRVGLAQGLMNLSQLARHIRSTVEARTQKSVQLGAIQMALARYRDELPNLDFHPRARLADRVSVQRGLAIATFRNSPRVHRGLLELQQKLRADGRYLTLTEGLREITVIIEARDADRLEQIVGVRPVRMSRGIASLSVFLTDENLAEPGILYRVLQPLALQGVNLAEVASTTTEFHVYLDEDDVMMAMESLQLAFS